MTINRKWYVVYTRPNAEKKFADQVNQFTTGCDVYLPLITENRQWSDRVKLVSRPLFKSYVFVYLNDDEYHYIKRLSGFVEYIKFNGKPSVVSSLEVEKIKKIIASGFPCEPTTRKFALGQSVEIKSGSLRGYQGKLVDIKNDAVFAIEVQGIDQNLLMSVPASLLSFAEEA
ncbi:transcriptional activator RfaH [Pseudoalteromonas luteoviolacea]|nr:transcriptional activator RfaH [Pseudoalteromonas luteoviolacea]